MCLRLMILSLPADSVTLLSSQKLQPWLASFGQGSDDSSWLKYTGDIANCYDELDHDRCLDGVRWALDSLPGWLGKRRADGFSCSVLDRKDCRLGKSESTERVNISLAQVYEVCEFDCRNSVILVHGGLRKRTVGAPMGGFLSAFYAILCFALIEHRQVMPRFRELGLPGGIKRYLDDLIITLQCNSFEQQVEAELFIDWLKSAEVYPPPLRLNMEAEGDQEFLEAKVFTHDGRLCCCLLNKTADDMMAEKERYRLRLPAANASRQKELQDLVDGIATRAVQMTTERDSGLYLHPCLLQLRLEVASSGLHDRFFWKAMHKIAVKYPTPNVLKAIQEIGN